MNDLIKINDAVPEDVRKKIDELKAGLKDGTFAVFKGPISDNAGKVVLPKDEVADDAWKGKINFFVKGVEGKVPSGK
jgi:basic membrane protein A